MHRVWILITAASLLAWPLHAGAQRGGPDRPGRHEGRDRHRDRGDRGRGERGPGDRRGRGRRLGHRAFRDRAVVTAFAPRSGPPGTVVTIRGRRFDPDASLLFGGRPVRPTRVTLHEITFVVPRRSEGGVIRLRLPNRPDLLVGSFEVGRPPPPPPPRARLREEARRRWAERRRRLAADEAARREVFREREAELARTRAERRRRRRAAVRARFEAEFLDQPATRDELALHARRMARLGRMSRLAAIGLNEALAVRIGVLEQREERRHQRRMDDLRAAFRASRGGTR